MINLIYKALLCLLFFAPHFVFAQWNLVLKVKLTTENKVFIGAQVEVFSEEELLESFVMTDKKYISITLDPEKYYSLHFSGATAEYMKKRIDVDTRNVPDVHKGNTYFPMNVEIFKKLNPKLDYKELEYPLTTIRYGGRGSGFIAEYFKAKDKEEYDQSAIDYILANNKELNSQVQNLEDEILKKRQEIEEREKELKEKEKEVSLTKAILDKLSSETLDRKEKLEHIEKSYSQQKAVLDNSKKEYKQQKEVLAIQEEELKNALIKLDIAKKEFVETEKQMNNISRLLENQKSITYISIFILFIISILGALAYRNYKLQKKQSQIISAQKFEVEKQKEKVEEAHREITDSIDYAKRIQGAILPPLKLVKEYLNESFILYKPKDVVAGDFYWMMPLEDMILFAAADCTGHGVPGALVSVVCNNGLNRSVREHGLTEPGKILDKTREIVIQEFEKSEEDVKDGMDIALCALKGNTLYYAGAHNPLWIIRKGDDKVEEIKANKQPIGKFDQLLPYTTHQVELNPGDSIYLFSDGFVDQFGGEKGKKLKAPNFRRLLLSMNEQPMSSQHQLLDRAFEEWKGELEQIDDVCVIGVRV